MRARHRFVYGVALVILFIYGFFVTVDYYFLTEPVYNQLSMNDMMIQEGCIPESPIGSLLLLAGLITFLLYRWLIVRAHVHSPPA